MLISKREFVEIMNELQTANDLRNAMGSVVDKYRSRVRNDFIDGAGFIISHEELVIDLLEKIFDDKADWIGWWVFETDYGMKTDMAKVYDNKGEKVIAELHTAEDLYDFLVNEMKKL